MDCIFCKIINNEIPSYTIYEDDYVKCFLDINPLEVGHTLIVPKKHFVDNSDIDDEYLIKIHNASKVVIGKISTKLKPTGYKIVQNNGFLQDVKHYHVHIIPSYNRKKTNKKVEDIYTLLTK